MCAENDVRWLTTPFHQQLTAHHVDQDVEEMLWNLIPKTSQPCDRTYDTIWLSPDHTRTCQVVCVYRADRTIRAIVTGVACRPMI